MAKTNFLSMVATAGDTSPWKFDFGVDDNAASADGLRCVECAKGTYSGAVDAGACAPCPGVSTTVGSGEGACTICDGDEIEFSLTARCFDKIVINDRLAAVFGAGGIRLPGCGS